MQYNSSELNLIVRVNKRDAETVRNRLLREGVLDRRRAILRKDDVVEIPVIKKSAARLEYVKQKDPIYLPPRLSLDRVRRSLGDVLGERAGYLRGWELLGDILVVCLPLETEEEKREVGRRLLQFFPQAKAVVNRKGIIHTFREPRVELLCGIDTETVHKENGCRFRMDVARVMFSAGNLEERRRMAYISDKKEVVLDMFAGIGQFTIPIARHSKPKKVIAIEKNPVALRYLWDNIKLNGLSNVEVLLGDCREKSPTGKVDRVVMGYIFDTHIFLPHALNALRDGGVIHYHSLVKRGDEAREKTFLHHLVTTLGYAATRIKRRKVKSYSPRYHHMVFDIEVERSTTLP
jgi:tRNA wybutosine-synthesizing protein 2